MIPSSTIRSYTSLDVDVLRKAFLLTCVCRELGRLYQEHPDAGGPYVYSTSYGHEAIQLAVGMQVQPDDYVYPYYRDDALWLGMGLTPRELLLQWLARPDEPISGGKTNYATTALRREGYPTVPFGGSASGMHVIPATGAAQGLAYLASQKLLDGRERSVVVCSLGDGAVTRGEVAEAFQMAVLKKLPIVYLVQDNDWSGSVKSEEIRAVDAYEYAGGFRGMRRMRVNGADFVQTYESVQLALEYVRNERSPILLHAKCPLLGNHSSALQKERYRDEENIELQAKDDPILRLRKYLIVEGESEESISQLENRAHTLTREEFQKVFESTGAATKAIDAHIFASAKMVAEEAGIRDAESGNESTFAEALTQGLAEILEQHPEALYYGTEVLNRQAGEPAGLAGKFDSHRMFNIPPQETYAIGATAGLTAVGCKPIVRIQSADYLRAGIQPLAAILARSGYLSGGQFPVPALIRVPTGAGGGNGPYGSASIESALLTIPGIKVVYPSNAADARGLLRGAFADPNPVVFLEHQRLATLPEAGTALPGGDYVIPPGKSRVVQAADEEKREEGYSAVVITYGMGVYWALAASETFAGSVEILDLRSLQPLDWEGIAAAVKRHSKVLIVTEEPLTNSFAEALAGRISSAFFQSLDAPVFTCGAMDLPAVPLNAELEKQMLPDAHTVAQRIKELLDY